jgi:hypothetical protein
MSSEVDAQIARAQEAMARIAEGYRSPARARRTEALGRRIARIAAADIAILLAAVVIGLVVPLGFFGALLVMALLVAVTLFLAMWPPERAPTPARLAAADLRALPAQTERWLHAQRPALPAPAVTVADRIGQRLDVLSPQLAGLTDEVPEAAELRKLVAEQLPAFVDSYRRVPQPLRAQPRNGKTPDAELVDGLKLIEQEIGELTERLAQGDLDQLATRGRFLELKYKDGDA